MGAFSLIVVINLLNRLCCRLALCCLFKSNHLIMDQTLDQIVKSRNIKFNGKIGQNKNKSQQLFQQKRQSSNNQNGFKQRKNQGFVQRRNQMQRSYGGNVQKRG